MSRDMVQARNYAGSLSSLSKKKFRDVRQKLKPSLNGPLRLRPGRRKITRRKCCFHCDQKFHSSFCQKLNLRNNRLRKLMTSKLECLTCRKRFKGIANYLLHRTLHSELPQNQNQHEGNTDDSRSSTGPDPSHKVDQDSDMNEENWMEEGSVFRPSDKLDPATQSKQQGETEFGDRLPLDSPRSKSKAIQPTGARKRKGKLQIQYISPNAIPEDHSDDEDIGYLQRMLHEEGKLSEENENPKVFVISTESDLTPHVNGILDDSTESVEHGVFYEDEVTNGNDVIRIRRELETFENSCYGSCCHGGNQDHHHCNHRNRHHDHSFHDDHHHSKFHSDHSDRGEDHRSGSCRSHCHDRYSGNHIRCHKDRCHNGCCPGPEWHDMFKADERDRLRPDGSSRFGPEHGGPPKEYQNSMPSPDERSYQGSSKFDEFSHFMHNSSYDSRNPLPINYRPDRGPHLATSRGESSSYKSYKALSDSYPRRKRIDSDLAPIDALADNVGYSRSESRRLSNGDHVPKKDIFTAPGSAIRRMKELVSKYSDRHPKGGSGPLGIAMNKQIPPEFYEYDDADMMTGRGDVPIDGKAEAYACHICGKEFAWAVTLKRHMQIHAGVRQFQCSICNKAFTRSHHLKRHMTTHTGEKPYVCHICNKAYSRSDRLSSHMSSHEGYVSNKKRGKALEQSADSGPVDFVPASTEFAPKTSEFAQKSKEFVSSSSDGPQQPSELISAEPNRREEGFSVISGPSPFSTVLTLAAAEDLVREADKIKNEGREESENTQHSFPKLGISIKSEPEPRGHGLLHTDTLSNREKSPDQNMLSEHRLHNITGYSRDKSPKSDDTNLTTPEMHHSIMSVHIENRDKSPRSEETNNTTSEHRLHSITGYSGGISPKKEDANNTNPEPGHHSITGYNRNKSPKSEINITISEPRSQSRPGYKGLDFSKEEREVIPSRFQLRPSDLGPPGIYIPSTYAMAGRNPPFIPGTLIDGASIERPSELDMFTGHVRSRRSPAASEAIGSGSLSYRSDTELPKRSPFGGLSDARDDYPSKPSRMGGVSMFFHDMPHNSSMRRDGMPMDPLMHYSGRDDRPPFFNTDIHNPYMKLKLEDMSEGSNHRGSFKAKASDVKKAKHKDKPGAKSSSEAHESQMNMFTFRNMVTKKVLPRTFVCKTCNKSFTRSHHLRRHELIHSGHKPFKCTICGRAFNRSDHLNLHLATHYQSGNGKIRKKNFVPAMIGDVLGAEGVTLAGDIMAGEPVSSSTDAMETDTTATDTMATDSVMETESAVDDQSMNDQSANFEMVVPKQEEAALESEDGNQVPDVSPGSEHHFKPEVTDDTFNI